MNKNISPEGGSNMKVKVYVFDGLIILVLLINSFIFSVIGFTMWVYCKDILAGLSWLISMLDFAAMCHCINNTMSYITANKK